MKSDLFRRMEWARTQAVNADAATRSGQRVVAILVDSDTYYDFLKEIHAHQHWEHERIEDGRWRGVLIEPHDRLINMVDMDVLTPGDKIISRQPFMISVRFERTCNGRIVYVDHPDTDERWK